MCMPLVPGLSVRGWLACLVEWTEMELTLAGKEPELQKFKDARNGAQASYVFSCTVHRFACNGSGAISMGDVISCRAVVLIVQGAERLTTDLMTALVGKARCRRFYSIRASFKKDYLERSAGLLGTAVLQCLHRTQTAGTHVV